MCVKGLLAIFCAHGSRQNPVGLFSDRLGLVEESVLESGCRGHFIARLFAPFFSLRRHPYPSLRESVCRKRQSVGPREARHRVCFATVPQTLAVSIRITLGKQGRVHGDTQTGVSVCGGLFPREGPMQPSSSLLPVPRCVSGNGFPARSILVLSGEAESGSAGTQPDKE